MQLACEREKRPQPKRLERHEIHRNPPVNTTSFLCSLHTPGCNDRCKAFPALESQRRRHLASLCSLVTMPLSTGVSFEAIVLTAAGARYSVLSICETPDRGYGCRRFLPR